MSLPGYDAWLERPYTDRAALEADYEEWCESMGYDADQDHWDEFEEAVLDGPD